MVVTVQVRQVWVEQIKIRCRRNQTLASWVRQAIRDKMDKDGLERNTGNDAGAHTGTRS